VRVHRDVETGGTRSGNWLSGYQKCVDADVPDVTGTAGVSERLLPSWERLVEEGTRVHHVQVQRIVLPSQAFHDNCGDRAPLLGTHGLLTSLACSASSNGDAAVTPVEQT
jgi:hypothetical protein